MASEYVIELRSVVKQNHRGADYYWMVDGYEDEGVELSYWEESERKSAIAFSDPDSAILVANEIIRLAEHAKADLKRLAEKQP